VVPLRRPFGKPHDERAHTEPRRIGLFAGSHDRVRPTEDALDNFEWHPLELARREPHFEKQARSSEPRPRHDPCCDGNVGHDEDSHREDRANNP